MTSASFTTIESPTTDLNAVLAAAKALLSSLSFDENGILLGQTMAGGNGGLISRETNVNADALRRALNRFEARVVVREVL